MTVRIEPATIRAAFEQHHRRYAMEKRWRIPDHLLLWHIARSAFQDRDKEAFSHLYGALNGFWQVFRRRQNRWSEEEARERLLGLDPEVGNRQLSTLFADDAGALWDFLCNVKDIKTTKTGPSVMAMSKFLHFWNPRLFVIVDDTVMWRYVFAHRWLRQPVEGYRAALAQGILDASPRRSTRQCDLASYLAVLLWAASLVRENRAILPVFVEHVNDHRDNAPVPDDIGTHEAAAVEWLLLGLVELAPSGVQP